MKNIIIYNILICEALIFFLLIPTNILWRFPNAVTVEAIETSKGRQQ
jgi:hypothetical protein